MSEKSAWWGTQSRQQTNVLNCSIKAPLVAILGLMATVGVCDKLHPWQIDMFGRSESSQAYTSWNWTSVKTPRAPTVSVVALTCRSSSSRTARCDGTSATMAPLSAPGYM